MSEFEIGSIWLDKDKRALGGNRRVEIQAVDGDRVHYIGWVAGKVYGPKLSSKIGRFLKAFRPCGPHGERSP